MCFGKFENWKIRKFIDSMKMLPAFPNIPTNPTTHQLHLDNSNNSNAQRSPNGSAATTPKRGSSMIFRIEHLLPLAPPTSTSTPTTITTMSTTPATIFQLQTLPTTSVPMTSSHSGRRTTKSNRTPGVYIKQFASKDTVSETISTVALLSCCNNIGSATGSATGLGTETTEQMEQQRSPHGTRTYCSIMQGILRITPTVMRRVKLSEDIHSYNALFEVFNGEVRLRIVRDIARDEELIAWFDEEVTLLMSIPFLTPLNIQGNNRYTCHICQLTFETPNPLKIHLALSCGRHTLDILWIRLHYTLKSTMIGHHNIPMRLIHHLQPITAAHCSPVQMCSSSSTTIPTISPAINSNESQRLSAFKPISPSNSQLCTVVSASMSNMLPVTTATLSLPQTSHSTSTNPFLPTISTPLSLLQPPSSNPLNAAAQIEAIVSNMGASKQGHLCIYCGKVYSRKYGLKIHIRTHTGFKPLKCKFCLRPFGDPSNLNKHVRLHLQASAGSTSGETVEGYKCHMCHKTLARRRDLQRHIESRHNTAS